MPIWGADHWGEQRWGPHLMPAGVVDQQTLFGQRGAARRERCAHVVDGDGHPLPHPLDGSGLNSVLGPGNWQQDVLTLVFPASGANVGLVGVGSTLLPSMEVRVGTVTTIEQFGEYEVVEPPEPFDDTDGMPRVRITAYDWGRRQLDRGANFGVTPLRGAINLGATYGTIRDPLSYGTLVLNLLGTALAGRVNYRDDWDSMLILPDPNDPDNRTKIDVVSDPMGKPLSYKDTVLLLTSNNMQSIFTYNWDGSFHFHSLAHNLSRGLVIGGGRDPGAEAQPVDCTPGGGGLLGIPAEDVEPERTQPEFTRVLYFMQQQNFQGTGATRTILIGDAGSGDRVRSIYDPAGAANEAMAQQICQDLLRGYLAESYKLKVTCTSAMRFRIGERVMVNHPKAQGMFMVTGWERPLDLKPQLVHMRWEP